MFTPTGLQGVLFNKRRSPVQNYSYFGELKIFELMRFPRQENEGSMMNPASGVLFNKRRSPVQNYSHFGELKIFKLMRFPRQENEDSMMNPASVALPLYPRHPMVCSIAMFTSYVSNSQTGWHCFQIRLVFKSDNRSVIAVVESKN